MEAIRIEIPKEMFSPAETMSIDDSQTIDPITLGPDTVSFESPVSWHVDITNTGQSFLVRGEVRALGLTSCARCLEDASLDIQGEIEGYFITEEAANRQEVDLEEDEYEIIGEDKSIDLAPLIENAILLSLPRIPLCSDGCKGLCPSCGANLNFETCSCTLDDKEYDTSPFSVLKDLDL